MKTKQELQNIIENRADKIWSEFCMYYSVLHTFKRPTVVLNNRIYKTAGRCFVEDNKIELSSKLFNNNYAEMLDTILPHEIAHQIDFNLNGEPKRWHGKTWSDIMQKYGLPNNPYHSLEL